jgi:hypothetical protein
LLLLLLLTRAAGGCAGSSISQGQCWHWRQVSESCCLPILNNMARLLWLPLHLLLPLLLLLALLRYRVVLLLPRFIVQLLLLAGRAAFWRQHGPQAVLQLQHLLSQAVQQGLCL